VVFDQNRSGNALLGLLAKSVEDASYCSVTGKDAEPYRSHHCEEQK